MNYTTYILLMYKKYEHNSVFGFSKTFLGNGVYKVHISLFGLVLPYWLRLSRQSAVLRMQRILSLSLANVAYFLVAHIGVKFAKIHKKVHTRTVKL